ncbi:maleylacetate reductase [Actinomadura alba]
MFARGARRRLVDEVTRLGLRRLMVITSERQLDLARALTDGLQDRLAVSFTRVLPHVPDSVAREARTLAEEHSVDGLLSVGGGSITGTAKIVALTSGLPIVSVPTTYAGSELTPVWGMTTGGRKETGRSPMVLPKVVIYDPQLVEGLPRKVATSSALNAMAHCIEALWMSTATPVTTLMALEGVRVLRQGLDELVTDLTPAAFENLVLGAYLAGASFAVAGSGLHHKICHALGGAFDLPHAETHAVVLPHALDFNIVAMRADSATRLTSALGGTDAVESLRDLYRRVGAPVSLAGLGLTAEQLRVAIQVVIEKLPIENPRPVDADAVRAILTAAYRPKP